MKRGGFLCLVVVLLAPLFLPMPASSADETSQISYSLGQEPIAIQNITWQGFFEVHSVTFSILKDGELYTAYSGQTKGSGDSLEISPTIFRCGNKTVEAELDIVRGRNSLNFSVVVDFPCEVRISLDFWNDESSFVLARTSLGKGERREAPYLAFLLGEANRTFSLAEVDSSIEIHRISALHRIALISLSQGADLQTSEFSCNDTTITYREVRGRSGVVSLALLFSNGFVGGKREFGLVECSDPLILKAEDLAYLLILRAASSSGLAIPTYLEAEALLGFLHPSGYESRLWIKEVTQARASEADPWVAWLGYAYWSVSLDEEVLSALLSMTDSLLNSSGYFTLETPVIDVSDKLPSLYHQALAVKLLLYRSQVELWRGNYEKAQQFFFRARALEKSVQESGENGGFWSPEQQAFLCSPKVGITSVEGSLLLGVVQGATGTSLPFLLNDTILYSPEYALWASLVLFREDSEEAWSLLRDICEAFVANVGLHYAYREGAGVLYPRSPSVAGALLRCLYEGLFGLDFRGDVLIVSPNFPSKLRARLRLLWGDSPVEIRLEGVGIPSSFSVDCSSRPFPFVLYDSRPHELNVALAPRSDLLLRGVTLPCRILEAEGNSIRVAGAGEVAVDLSEGCRLFVDGVLSPSSTLSLVGEHVVEFASMSRLVKIRLVDSHNAPLSGAEVCVLDDNLTVLADEDGTVALPEGARFEVRWLGSVLLSNRCAYSHETIPCPVYYLTIKGPRSARVLVEREGETLYSNVTDLPLTLRLPAGRYKITVYASSKHEREIALYSDAVMQIQPEERTSSPMAFVSPWLIAFLMACIGATIVTFASLRPKGDAKYCPFCGSRRLSRTEQTTYVEDLGTYVRIPAYKCGSCGKKFALSHGKVEKA